MVSVKNEYDLLRQLGQRDSRIDDLEMELTEIKQHFEMLKMHSKNQERLIASLEKKLEERGQVS